jgi:outer membrane protein OmpA-like peptidoglycan-associated protein
MAMKNVRILVVSLVLLWSVSVLAQTCENGDTELETAMSAAMPSEQIDKLVKLLQRCPDFSKGLNNLGVLFEEQGKLKEAEALYRRATHTDQRFPYPYIGLGDIYFQQKKHGLAAAMYNEVLILYKSALVQNNFPELEKDIPRIQDRLKKCQAAIPMATRSLKVVSSEVIESQLKAEPEELTRGIQYKPKIRPKISLMIHFEYDSAEISPTSMAQMEQIGKALCSDTLKNNVIAIEGHADATGSDEYNLRLSERRSESVKKYLVRHYGLESNRLKIFGYGEARPIDSNDTEVGRAANRRVELVNAGSI